MSSSNLPMLAPARTVAAVIPQNYANPGLSLSQIFSIVYAYRKTTILIAAVITLLAVIALKLMPRAYEATATLIVNYEINDPLGGKEFPIGLLGSYMSTQIDLMQSPLVLLPVIENLHLTSKKKFTNGFNGDPANLPEWVESVISKNLTIEQGHYGNQLINVTYSDTDAAEAADIANAVANTYIEQHVQRLSGPASERAERYTAQIDDLKKRVDAAQQELTEFRQRTGLIDSRGPGGGPDDAQLSTLEQRLQEVQNDRRAAETRADVTQAYSPQVMGSTVIQTLKSQAAEQRSRLAQLRGTLGPRHPEIIQLESQIEATDRSIAAELKNYNNGASSDLKSSSELEKKLQSAVAEERSKVLSVHRLQDEAAKYELELESAQAVYKRALDGYDQIMLASSARYSNVTVVSRATRPLKSSKPKAVKMLLLGIFGGMFCGIGAPFFYELLRRRIRCRDDIEREYGIPVLVEFEATPALRMPM